MTMTSEMTIGDYWRVIRRRLGFILLPMILVSAGGYMWTRKQPELYSTRALIEIQKNTIRAGAGLQRAYVSPVEKETVEKLATSREVTSLAARELADDPASRYAREDPKRLAEWIRDNISVSTLANSNNLQISATGTDPVRITDACNSMAKAIIEYYDAERRKSIEELRDYLVEQIGVYGDRITMIENKLSELRGSPYSSKKAPPRTPAETLSRMEAVEADLTAVSQKAQSLADRRNALRSALEKQDLSGMLGFIRASDIQTDARLLSSKNAEMAALMDKYTASHPSVMKVKEEAEKLENDLKRRSGPAAEIELSMLEQELGAALLDQDRLSAERIMVLQAMESLPQRLKEEKGLDRELSVATSVSQMFRERLEDLNISISTPADRLFLVEIAERPTRPMGSTRYGTPILGAVAGLLMGLTMAFIMEALDTSLIALRDVERVVGRPILAVIPQIRIPRDKLMEKEHPTIPADMLKNIPLLVDARSPAAEAYRTLRAVLQSRFFDAGFRTLLVTSATPQEGKTTTLVNLALACAGAGFNTLVIAANMRHPVLGRYFPIDRSKGLHEVLTSRLKPEDAVQATGYDNLSIIDSGTFARRPAELLARRELDELIAWAKQRYAIVLVDAPPTLPVADSTTIAPRVDGVMIVYLVSVSPRDALIRCRETLEEVGGNIVGVVFNDIWSASQNDYAGYYYHHRYASDEFSRL